MINFKLPAKGALKQNGPDDPLSLYYHPLAGYLYRERIRQGLSLLKPPYDSILEIGYGSGILMPTLVSVGRSVSGIDINSDPLDVAHNLLGMGVSVSLQKGDIFSARYLDESFDLIVAISIIEHIDDVEGFTKKVCALLRPGGHFLAGMPKVGGFMNAAFRMIGYRDMESRHVSSHKRFLEAADGLFSLIGADRMPSRIPAGLSIYFNMLFSKKR